MQLSDLNFVHAGVQYEAVRSSTGSAGCAVCVMFDATVRSCTSHPAYHAKQTRCLELDNTTRYCSIMQERLGVIFNYRVAPGSKPCGRRVSYA